MSIHRLVLGMFLCAIPELLLAQTPDGQIILEDHFDRQEEKPGQDEIGLGWKSQTRARSKGVKQVWLEDGAVRIERNKEVNHGVVLAHEIDFQDAVIELRFKLAKGDDIGIDLADLKDKSVHAGHLCKVMIHLNRADLMDLKTGRMELETYNRQKAGTLTEEDKARIKGSILACPMRLSAEDWHDLSLRIEGDVMTLTIDGQEVGKLQSPGIGHPRKNMLRLAIETRASLDDVKITRLTLKSSGN